MIPKRILLIRPDRLGDLILSLPVAETLKMRFPDSTVAYLASAGPSRIAPLAPYVDEWLIDGGNSEGLRGLKSSIQNGHFEYAIELRPSLKTAVAAFLSGVPQRIGTARRGYSLLYNRRVNVQRKGSGRHQTDLELEMLTPMGIETSGLAPNLIITATALHKGGSLVGANRKRYIVMHPGSGGSAPNWPSDYYRELARLLAEMSGRDIVITGNNDRVGHFDERCLDLNGKTDLEGLAGVVAGSDLFISGSTGPLHLADALGVRCISFFVNHNVIGPERWGPRRNMKNILMPLEKCSCGRLSRCRCLEKIKPEAALDKIRSVLGI